MTSVEHPVTERPPLELSTTVQALTLRELEPPDAQAFVDFVVSNREHLTEFGADTLPPHTVDDVIGWLCNRPALDFKPGIWLHGELIGYVLVSHLSHALGDTDPILAESPNGYVLGYALGSEHSGKGYATEACRTLLDYVRSEFGVSDSYSGVRTGNHKSAAVLERLGFVVTKVSPTEVSYRLSAR